MKCVCIEAQGQKGSNGEEMPSWMEKQFSADALLSLFADALLAFPPPQNNADRHPIKQINILFPPWKAHFMGTTSPHSRVWVCAPYINLTRNHHGFACVFLLQEVRSVQLSFLMGAVDPHLTFVMAEKWRGRSTERGDERGNVYQMWIQAPLL